ncbi:hypothetical protein M2480_001172 [Parabacteroides sp. PFB2-12]|uniref:hypothetical protein n=1 Tax=unclassified Parabacteroides TaxID=2649774 RepID=UPI0024733341|nr:MULTISPECIES: hypothetical protein [unclassified Parabacteroides]MDH6342550.1 hypothetical protein [Parabacteroides sp. PM6-13]MDH6390202.1 hypothetical protein [Parabacteroides sp. PFB2-12]
MKRWVIAMIVVLFTGSMGFAQKADIIICRKPINIHTDWLCDMLGTTPRQEKKVEEINSLFIAAQLEIAGMKNLQAKDIKRKALVKEMLASMEKVLNEKQMKEYLRVFNIINSGYIMTERFSTSDTYYADSK